MLAYAGWRPRSRRDLVAIAVGYAAAIAAPVWRSDVATIVLAVALLVVTARGYAVAAGTVRRERLSSLQAGGALAAVLLGGALARAAFPSAEAADASLLAYEAVLVAVAVGLYARLRGPAPAAVADLVVELGEARSGTLRDRLARALGDPTVEVGYWSADASAYVDAAGRSVPLPGPGSGRSATPVERDGLPFAVLVHDAAVLQDPALVEAVAAATRLTASNAALQAEVREQAAELMASRRRLLVAADEERRRIEARLHEGPERRLAGIADTLSQVAGDPRGAEHVERARSQLSHTLDDLRELGRGLHPRELVEAGLEGALASLAERAPLQVDVEVRVTRLPDELEATVYFVCAEALANVAKYASAFRATVAVTASDGRLSVVVADDGVGGADPARGTGLRGLADRVEALGGGVQVESPPGAGTRLAAGIPLGGEGAVAMVSPASGSGRRLRPASTAAPPRHVRSDP